MRRRAIAALALTVGIVGCSMFKNEPTVPAVSMTASRDVVAAQGKVRAEAAPNGNTKLLVEVKHLALPQAVDPNATTYVVWARPENGGPITNLGALRVDSDLKGSLSTITPLRDFEVFITAEPDPAVLHPSHPQLLHAEVHRAG